MRVVIRGGGDIATGIALRLIRSGMEVVLCELANPTAIRRTVSFSECMRTGETAVEGITARRAHLNQVERLLAQGIVPVLEDPSAGSLPGLHADALVDAILAKVNLGTRLDMAPVVVGVGPGFTAGEDCHAVVETMRGHTLGRVYYEGSALPNTNIPGLIGGFAGERVLRAPADGVFHQLLEIGAQVEAGDVAGTVGDAPMVCQIGGILRGILPDATPVHQGMKAGDVDPRCRLSHCYQVSDKALAVGGGVLEAILRLSGKLRDRPVVPMDSGLYGHLERELLEGHSLAALAALIQGGRELEFSLDGRAYFLSRHGSARDVSLWEGRRESAYDDIWQLLSQARLGAEPLSDCWDRVTFDTLF